MATDTYPLQDLLYRTTALTDDAGDIVEAYDTDAYGNTLIFDAAGTGGDWWADNALQTDIARCDFIFVGRRFDTETSAYYNRVRYYMPVLGRFISPDPSGSLALYVYVQGRVVVGLDPSGLILYLGTETTIAGQDPKTKRGAAVLAMLESLKLGLKQLCKQVDFEEVNEDGSLKKYKIVLKGDVDPNDVACCCLRDIIANKNDVQINVRSLGGSFAIPKPPETQAKDEKQAYGSGVGSGSDVWFHPGSTIEENRPKEDKPNWVKVEPSVLLGHELCGHALPMLQGKHVPVDLTTNATTAMPKHEQHAVEVENEIRAQLGLPKRPTDIYFPPGRFRITNEIIPRG